MNTNGNEVLNVIINKAYSIRLLPTGNMLPTIEVFGNCDQINRFEWITGLCVRKIIKGLEICVRNV